MTGVLKNFSTDAVPPKDRLDYWHEDVLRRLDTRPSAEMAPVFAARLLCFSGGKAELLEHSGSALVASRDAARIRRDGADDISLNFMVKCTRATVSHAGLEQHRLRVGDMMIIDLASPSEMSRASHRVISLFLPRARVRAACGDPAALAGRFLARRGMPAMLRGHMQNTMDQAAVLSSQQRVLAVNIAADMALSILQAEPSAQPAMEAAATGLYHAGMMLIARDYANPQLNPAGLAAALGCSRASLFRAFRAQEDSIAGAIWTARLTRAHDLLRASEGRILPISEIAFCSGFHEITTFNKMFRNKYGMTPGELRGISVASCSV
jgi:AraC-like DNA-binding protein